MKTIYLDHNIARYFVNGFPKGHDASVERDALEEARSSYPEIRFAVSDWNVVEAARHCARAPAPLELADTYASLFESLRPVFIAAPDTLERAELRSIAFERWGMCKKGEAPNTAFSTYFIEIASDRIKDVLVGFTLRIYLRHLVSTPSSLAEFSAPVSTAVAAMKTCVEAYSKGVYNDRELQETILQSWFFRLLPERDPEGKWIIPDKRGELAREFAAAPGEVFTHCPALEVESDLADLRAATGGRKPREADTFDLMHAVPALGYCDAFISNDAHLRLQASSVCKKSGRPVIIAGKLSQALKGLR